MADAAHAKSQRAQCVLGALDRAQLFRRDLRVIGNARRQTGRRRLVPRAKAGATRELANLRLREAGFVERTAHAKLARGLTAGPVVAAIVGVAAVSDHRESTIRGNTGQRRIELVLAVVAAIGRIRAVFGAIELRRLDDLVPETGLARHGQRELTMSIGIAGAVGRDAQRGLSQNVGGRPRQIGAVGAPAEGDDQRLDNWRVALEGVLLCARAPRGHTATGAPESLVVILLVLARPRRRGRRHHRRRRPRPRLRRDRRRRGRRRLRRRRRVRRSPP